MRIARPRRRSRFHPLGCPGVPGFGTRVEREPQTFQEGESPTPMAKIANTADRKKMMGTTKSTDCPKCNKPTRIVKRVKDRERGTPGGVYISCSACDFYEKLQL